MYDRYLDVMASVVIFPYKRLVCVLIVCFSVLFFSPNIFRQGVHNIAFVSIQRQLFNGNSAAWGLGLRQIDAEHVSASLKISSWIENTTELWLTDTRMGLGSFDMEYLVAQFGDCNSQRMMAQRFVYQAQFAKAKAALLSVVAKCPSYGFANVELGLIYDKLQQPALAVTAFEKGGISAFARELAAVNYLTLARECDHQPEVPASITCVQWLNRALELAPHHVFAATRLAALTQTPPEPLAIDADSTPLWKDLRLNDLVVESFREWTDRDSSARSDALFSLARRFALQRDYHHALQLYQTVEELEPDNVRAHYYAGLAAMRMQQWEIAETSLWAALRQSSQTVNYMVAYARVQAYQGDVIAAVEWYLRALESEPCLPEAVIYLRAHPSAIPPGQALDDMQWELCRKQLNARYEAESSPTLVGTVVGDDTASLRHALQGRNGFLTYGPYQAVPPGRYWVIFRLRVFQELHPNCLRLDVSSEMDQEDGLWLVDLPVEYVLPNQIDSMHYDNVVLTFDSPGGGLFEYRVLEQCGNDTSVDWIEIEPVAP